VGVAQNVLELNQYFAEGLEVVHHLLVAFSQSTKHVKFSKHFRIVKMQTF
jgi:hypothetical protein